MHYSSCNDDVMQLSPLSSYAVLEVVEIGHASFNCTPSLAVCPPNCCQLDLTPANLEATIEAELILNYLSSCENGTFNDVTITSSLHTVVQVLMGLYNFSHPECQDDSCQNL